MSAMPTPIKAQKENGGDSLGWHCVRCNGTHLETACPVTYQPTRGGTGGCIRCGTTNLYVWNDWEAYGEDPDEMAELYRCPNCGLIASETT